MKIDVLRLSTRNYRDLRITTHVALVARAFGGETVYLPEGASPEIERTVKGITERFGGNFGISHYETAGQTIREKKKQGYQIVHLTMYGELLSKEVPRLRKATKLLIVVGAGKVPPEIYQLADFNISVTNQPHSEVGALAVAMHEILGGKEEKNAFSRARLRVVPNPKGKKIEKGTHD